MSQLVSVEGAVLGGYLLCLLLLFGYSIGQWRLSRLLPRHQPGSGLPVLPDRGPDASQPVVTVQLPVYNERYVVERLLRAVAALDYPADRLEIQLLDDSTDITTAIVERLVDELGRTGPQITHVRRPERSGYKAGALAYGLTLARGDFVAIFDADFVPEPDFLRLTMPHFAEPDVGAVQVPWVHLNEFESALTRVQAFLLSLHFDLEQPARSAGGLFLNFNGTAGVWRRTAIAAAGGWRAATVTEDIDLSYRAQLRSWRLVYLTGHACPAELPTDMSGLRSQQYRWMKGGAQNARLHLGAIRHAALPARVRRHAAQHLLASSTYLVILVMLLLSVPLAAVKNTAIAYDYADFGIPFVLSTLALFAVFRAARRPRGLAGHLRFGAQMLRFLVFTMGMTVHNGLAVLAGWAGHGGEFVRTPKFGSTTISAGASRTASAYTPRRLDPRILREVLVLAYLLTGVGIGWSRAQYALMPVQLIGCVGLSWVIGLSLWHPWLARRAARASARTIAADATPGVAAPALSPIPEEARP